MDTVAYEVNPNMTKWTYTSWATSYLKDSASDKVAKMLLYSIQSLVNCSRCEWPGLLFIFASLWKGLSSDKLKFGIELFGTVLGSLGYAVTLLDFFNVAF